MSDRFRGVEDFSRCFAAALDEAFTPAAFPIRLPADEGMTGMALSTDRSLPWLQFPMSVASASSLPRLAERMPHANAYHSEFAAKRRRLTSLAMETNVDQLRALATGKWLAVLEVNLPASQVGRHIVRVQEDEGALVAIQDILEDVVAAKANNTLNARSTAALLFVKWHTANVVERVPALPMDEALVYAYFTHLRLTRASTHLRLTRASASRASSLLQAWAFCVHVLGFEDPSATEASLRCRGSAHRQFMSKRPLRRKDPLGMAMLWLFEVAACYEQDLVLRAIAGFICLCAHGRLRCSDGNLIVALDYEEIFKDDGSLAGGYIEASMAGNKTSKTKEKQTTFLPIVVPLLGLSGLGWFSSFVEARKALGLPDLPRAREAEQAPMTGNRVLVLPSWRANGFRMAEPMTSDEVTAGLLATLAKAGVPDGLTGNLASHSMKTTWLTAAGKAGMSNDMRQLLGYHLVKGATSALNYNRDNLADPIEKLEEITQAVVRGTFVPDAPRGARWPARMGSSVIGITGQVERLLGVSSDDVASIFAGSGGKTQRYDTRARTVSGSSDDAGIDLRRSEGCADEGMDEAGSPQSSSVRQSDEIPNLQHDEGNVGEADEADACKPEDAHEEVSVSGSSSPDLDDARPGESELEGFDVNEEDEEAALSVVAQLAMDDSSYKNRSRAERANVTMVYRHTTRRTIHYGNLDNFDMLACSRALNENYVQELRDPFKLWPLCRDCFP